MVGQAPIHLVAAIFSIFYGYFLKFSLREQGTNVRNWGVLRDSPTALRLEVKF
jgi:hypothetical protein